MKIEAAVVQTQQLDPQGVSELPGPLRAKNVRLVPTVGALEDAHVLHQAQNLQGAGMVVRQQQVPCWVWDGEEGFGSDYRHIDSAEHLGSSASVQQGQVLRRRYNDGT